MKFFFDNCIAWRTAEALDLLLHRDGFEIVALRSKFPEDTPDERWMPTLGNEGGWIVVSGEGRPPQQLILPPYPANPLPPSMERVWPTICAAASLAR